MGRFWLAMAAFCVFGVVAPHGAVAQVAGQVTLGSLLKELTDTSAIARFPQHFYTSHEASSYDRTRISPDKPGWFANSDQNQFIRTEATAGRTEKVMMDADGPGAIVRFWLTTDQNKRGTIRVYLDGASSPQISFQAYDLFTSGLNIKGPLAQAHPGYRPDGNGGNTLYLPIPYAKHCKVTWEEKSQGARYYQINYRSYDADTPLKTFSNADLEAARPLIARTNSLLSAPVPVPAAHATSMQITLAGGASQSLALPVGPACVNSLQLMLNSSRQPLSERALRSLIVEMTCDGEQTIWCPAAELFGSGVGINAVTNRFTQVSTTGDMRCCWVMPYRKLAAITLRNLGDSPITVSLSASGAPWKWDDRSMHFHASWHYETGMKTEPVREWNYNTLHGRGLYVGDALALYNPVATWYGEGNEKIWVDSDSFPSHLGTGTEDYYGFSYAPQPVFLSAFCGQPRLDQPMTQGHTTLIRTRSLDAIPFRTGLKFNFELISWKPTTLTCAAVTYWYALPGAESAVKPQPEDAIRPIPTLAEARAASAPPRKPNAVECEEMETVGKTQGIYTGVQDMDPFDGGLWSGGAQFLMKAEKPGDRVELRWKAADASPRKLKLIATHAPDFGTLEVSVNGSPAVSADCYGPSVSPSDPIDLGTVKPVDGWFVLSVKVTGANPAARGARYFFGLDCILSEPL